MVYQSYLNMGVAYNKSHNYFNALEAYEKAINVEKSLLKGLNNMGVTLSELGLQKEAIVKLNRSIDHFESGRKENEKQIHKDYHNRAKLLRILGKEDAMMEDINKSLFHKNFNQYSMIELAKYYTQKNDYDKALSHLNESIQYNKLNGYSLRSRSEFFYLFEQYKEALIDIKNVTELPSAKINNDIYELGKMEYFAGDNQNADIHYNDFLKGGGWNYIYRKANYQYGIVQFIDKAKGFGFILGKTWFNEYDSIYFKLSECRCEMSSVLDIEEE